MKVFGYLVTTEWSQGKPTIRKGCVGGTSELGVAIESMALLFTRIAVVVSDVVNVLVLVSLFCLCCVCVLQTFVMVQRTTSHPHPRVNNDSLLGNVVE